MSLLFPPLPGRAVGFFSVAAMCAVQAAPATAQVAARAPQVEAAVPAQALGPAIALLARQSGAAIALADGLDASRATAAVFGRMSVGDALARLLAGTGLEATLTPSGRWLVQAGKPATLATIVVTGRGDSDVYAGGQVARTSRVGVLGERDVFDTPFSVTSITAQAIEDQQARNISQVIGNDASVRNLTSNNSWNQDYLIRGLRVTADSVLFDGLPGLIPAYGNGTVNGIERVEIFKGPNSLLNGAGGNGLTVGGAINLVPKRATADPVTALTLDYASDTRGGAQVDIGRRFGVDGDFGARINLEYAKGRTAIDDFREKRTGTALSLDYKGPTWRVFVDAGTQRQRYDGSEPSGYLDPGTPIPAPPGGSRNFLQPWGYSDTRGNYWALRGEADIAKNLTASAAVARGTADYQQAFSYAYIKAGDGNFDENFQVGQGHNETLTRTASLRGSFDTGPARHEITLSAQTVRYTYAFTYGFDAASGGIDPIVDSNLYDPTYIDRPAYSFSPAVPKGKQTAPTIGLVDVVSFDQGRWQLVAGLRQQRLTDTRAPYDERAVTPAFALLWKPATKVSLYVNYIQALTTGPTAPSAGVSNPNEVFPPSKTRQYELGGKLDLGSLGLTAAVFDITQPSGRNVAGGGTLPVFLADGQQRNRGVELSAFGAPLKSLRLSGSVALVQAELTRTQDGALDGARVQGVPRTTVALNAQWDLPFVPHLTLLANGNWYSRVVLYSGYEQTLPSRGNLDLGARYTAQIAGQATTFRTTVANVFGQERWIGDAYGGVSKPAPRELRLSSTVEF